ncbi:MAG: hypothetical protein NZ772_07035 [Cyanobacteria bacterium]|nr:hypothetical protein [Cyanobacteriota bacterium]MDW8201305.1 hypothetical protein [Cyanobacteriota bacterium SKYGB_h_bin112]
MSSAIKQLKPAEKAACMPFMPYYQGAKRELLPYGISLYKQANLEGERIIEGGESVPFVITWNVATLPADLTRCQVRFANDADLSYEVTMASFEFIDFLIDVILNYKKRQIADFSQAFYRKLLRYETDI